MSVEKIEIIYDFNGYADPKIKDVEISRINGYKTITKKEGEKGMETEYQLINISGEDAKRLLECADQGNIDIEEIIEFINKRNKRKEVNDKVTDKEKKEKKELTKEQLKVNVYLAAHKGCTYREAVLATLEKTEGNEKKEEPIERTEGEIWMTRNRLEGIVFNLTDTSRMWNMPRVDQDRLMKACQLVNEVLKPLQALEKKET